MSLKPAISLHAILIVTTFLSLQCSPVSAQELKPKQPPVPKNDPYFNVAQQQSMGVLKTNATKRIPKIPSTINPSAQNPNALKPAPSSVGKNTLPNIPPNFRTTQPQTSFQSSNAAPLSQQQLAPNPYIQPSQQNPLQPKQIGSRAPTLQPPQIATNQHLHPRQNQMQPATQPTRQPAVNSTASNGQFQPGGQFQAAHQNTHTQPIRGSNVPFTQPVQSQSPRRLLRKVSGQTPITPQQKTQQQKTQQQRTYQPIEPDSVVSDASLSGENTIQKLPEKSGEETFEPGTLMAVVGGEPIFAAHLTLEANQLIEKFMPTAPENVKREQRKLVLEKLLNKYIESKMFYVDIIRGLPEGANVKDIYKTLGEHFDKEVLSKILKKNNVKTANAFDIRLRSQGVSLRQFRARWIEDEFVRYFLKDKITINPDVQHQEIIDYYRKNQETYRRKARARWEQIEVHFSKFTNRTQARQAIAKLGNEVVYGAPLTAVAKRGSHGLKATDGGQEGWVTQGSLVSKKLNEAVFSLPLNRLSDIIETDLGFHIVRVLERTPAGFVPFTEAQVEIKKKLTEKKREESFKKHLEKLRREIPVEILIKPTQTGGEKK